MIQVFSERRFRIDCKTAFAFSPLQRAHDLTLQYKTHGRSINVLCTFSLGSVYIGEKTVTIYFVHKLFPIITVLILSF